MLKVSLLRGQIIDIKHSKGYDRVYSKRFSLFHIRCIWGRGSTSDHQIIERSDLVKPEKKNCFSLVTVLWAGRQGNNGTIPVCKPRCLCKYSNFAQWKIST